MLLEVAEHLRRIAVLQADVSRATDLFRDALELLKLQEITYWLAHCLEGVCALTQIQLCTSLLLRLYAIEHFYSAFSEFSMPEQIESFTVHVLLQMSIYISEGNDSRQ
jgi:hypothetical protein